MSDPPFFDLFFFSQRDDCSPFLQRVEIYLCGGVNPHHLNPPPSPEVLLLAATPLHLSEKQCWIIAPHRKKVTWVDLALSGKKKSPFMTESWQRTTGLGSPSRRALPEGLHFHQRTQTLWAQRRTCRGVQEPRCVSPGERRLVLFMCNFTWLKSDALILSFFFHCIFFLSTDHTAWTDHF